MDPITIVALLGGMLGLASGLVKKYQESKVQEQFTITVKDAQGHEHTLTVPAQDAKRVAARLVEQTHLEAGRKVEQQPSPGPLSEA